MEELQQRVDSFGGALMASSTKDVFVYSADSLRSNVGEVMELLGDELKYALFDADMISRQCVCGPPAPVHHHYYHHHRH